MPTSGSTPGAAQRVGLVWEERASRYLERRGLRILKKRYRCRLGELDLVCLDGATLVIVEVKARGRKAAADPTESVDRRKQQRLVRATRHFLMTHPHWSEQPLRFDVLAATDIDTARPGVRWIKNAFDAGTA